MSQHESEREHRQLALHKAYRDTFATDAGQQVLADIHRAARMEQSTFVPGMDALTLAWWEGRRSLAADIKRHAHTEA